jgi:uncharacterized protein (UPF0276 family)
MKPYEFSSIPIPARAGVGLKPEHYEIILATSPDISWFEVHPENYMSAGGANHHYLRKIREKYPISLHGVGLSLGSATGLSDIQLNALRVLIDKYNPSLVSEHLSWSQFGPNALNDLLPVPYTQEALQVFSENIDRAQNFLQRKILLENPSSYFQLTYSTFSEWDFLVTLARNSGAGILLDINNIYVSAYNHGFSAENYIENIPPELVGEIHLAGHSAQHIGGKKILIDDHGSEVIADVWSLYEFALQHIGNRPTLIEWDANIPEWSTLYDEAIMADNRLRESTALSS